MPPSPPLNQSPPTSNRTALVILLGFPFVAVLALALHGIFYAFGYRYVPGRIPIASLIGIAIGTQLVIGFQEYLSQPSRRLVYASVAAYGLLALGFVARLAHLLPRDL